MRKHFLILLLFSILLISCNSQETPGAIYGTVKLIGASNSGDVEISLGNTILKVQSEESGGFVFLDVPIGSYSVTATKEGFISQTITGIVVTQSDAVLGIEFNLVSEAPPILPD